MSIGLILISIVCGVGIGILSGILGIGGGVLIVPLLRIGFGVSPLTATGTSIFTIFFTSISGTIGRMRSGLLCIKLGIIAGIGGAICSPLGVMLANKIGGTATMFIAAALIIYTAGRMIYKVVKTNKAEAQGETIEYADSSKFELSAGNIIKALLIGAGAGFGSGLVGVGGGFIITPLSALVFNLSMKDATGTSLLAISIIAIPGIISKAMLGQVDFIYGLIIAAGSILGAQIGAKITEKIPEKAVRIFFAIFLACIGVYMAINEVI